MPNEYEISSRCRNLITEYGDLLNFIIEEIETENEKLVINLDTAFGYAKATIQKEARKNGAKRVITIINKYANKKYESN